MGEECFIFTPHPTTVLHLNTLFEESPPISARLRLVLLSLFLFLLLISIVHWYLDIGRLEPRDPRTSSDLAFDPSVIFHHLIVDGLGDPILLRVHFERLLDA